jgi:hypothetical protein
MPTNQNAAKGGSPVRKIPTGKQVAQPEPEPEPELFTLDQLMIAQIIEGINNIAYQFPEGDPRLVRLFQARMCLIDYAGLEILTMIEQESRRLLDTARNDVESVDNSPQELDSARRRRRKPSPKPRRRRAHLRGRRLNPLSRQPPPHCQ